MRLSAAIVLTLAAQAYAAPLTPFVVDDFAIDQFTDGLATTATGVGPFNATRKMYLQSGVGSPGAFSVDENVNASLTVADGKLHVALGEGNTGKIRLMIEYTFPAAIEFSHPEHGKGKYNQLVADFISDVGERPVWEGWYNGFTSATSANEFGRQTTRGFAPDSPGLYLQPHVWGSVGRFTLEFYWGFSREAQPHWTYQAVYERVLVVNPEPTSLMLLGLGVVGLGMGRRRH